MATVGLVTGWRRGAADGLRAGAATATERLKEVVGVLGAAPELSAPLQPADETVADLVDRARAAGLRVDLETPGPLGLPPLADRAVYRVVQEALTNVARHASGAPVSVALSCSPEAVSVTVSNPVPGELVIGSGSGLLGLAERVRLTGGRFAAGVEDRARFVVRASVPYHPDLDAPPRAEALAAPAAVLAHEAGLLADSPN